MDLGINKLIFNYSNRVKIHVLTLLAFFYFQPVISSTIIIENKVDKSFSLYSNPVAFNKNGELVLTIKPFSIDSIISNTWLRLRSEAGYIFKDVLVGEFTKKIVIHKEDSISIENGTLLYPLSKVDSIIYLSDEKYLEEEFDIDLLAALNFNDTVFSLREKGEFLSPKKISIFASQNMKSILNSEMLLDSTISIKVRKYIVCSIIGFLLVKSSKSSELKVKELFNKLEFEEPLLFEAVLNENIMMYIYNNLDFYNRLTDFIKTMKIEVDTTKANIFYFTASWCGFCMEDLKKISEQSIDFHGIDLYIIAMEINNEGQMKIKNILEKTRLNYNLYFLKGGITSNENERLGVLAVPQIYYYDKKDNSEQINIILSEYLLNYKK